MPWIVFIWHWHVLQNPIYWCILPSSLELHPGHTATTLPLSRWGRVWTGDQTNASPMPWPLGHDTPSIIADLWTNRHPQNGGSSGMTFKCKFVAPDNVAVEILVHCHSLAAAATPRPVRPPGPPSASPPTTAGCAAARKSQRKLWKNKLVAALNGCLLASWEAGQQPSVGQPFAAGNRTGEQVCTQMYQYVPLAECTTIYKYLLSTLTEI
jgi:hypothetical protein